MIRELKLIPIFLGNAMQAQMEYRASLAANIVTTVVSVASAFAVIFAMFDQAGTIGGWTLAQGIVLAGVAQMVDGVMDCWLYPNLSKIPEYVRRGELDLMLMKPLNSQFLVTFRHIQFWQSPMLLAGFSAVLYGMHLLNAISLGNLALFAVMFTAGAAILYSIYVGLSTLAFWFTKIEEVAQVTYLISATGNFPVTAFPGWARAFLTFVLPVAFITNVPAEAASGRLTWHWGLGALVLGCASLWASIWAWRRALAGYTSASS